MVVVTSGDVPTARALAKLDDLDVHRGAAWPLRWSCSVPCASGAAAQEPEVEGATPERTAAIDGPPAPVSPATISRDDNGDATVRAIRLTTPLDVDGSLDEAVYTENPPFGDLIQTVPATGQPASERTDAVADVRRPQHLRRRRVLRLGAARRVDRQRVPRATARRCGRTITIGVGFDTFYDRRSGFMFYASPLGAFSDYSIIDEGQPNGDWNPVWNVRTGRFEGGWTMEMIIPFKSIRYRGGTNQTWGFQVRRSIRRKNEWTYLTAAAGVDGRPAGV